MKTRLLEKVYGFGLLAILAGVVVHAPLSVGLGTLWPHYALLIKSWKEIVMLLLVPLAVWLVTRRRLWRGLSRDWVFRLVVAYAVLHCVVAAVLWQGAAATLAGLAIDLRYVLFFGLLYVAVRAMPRLRRPVIAVATIGAFVVVGFATAQLFLPPDILRYIGYSNDTIVPYLTVDKNPDFIRVNSTLRGPNPLGAYAGMAGAVLAAAWVRGRIATCGTWAKVGAVVLAVCSAVALWISYSRSALVGGVVAVGLVWVVALWRRIPRRAWLAGGVLLAVLCGGVLLARDTSFVANVFFHENAAEGNAVNSNEGHADSLTYGIDRLLHQPFGAGVGSTGSASLLGSAPTIVENHYLFVAHEAGWLGLGLFMTVFVLVMMRLWRSRADWLSLGVFASGIGLGLIGLLLPVWADDTVSIVWWGLAAVALAGGKEGDGKRSTK